MLIAKAAMQKLLELEGKAKAGKETHGYSGVEKRVCQVKTSRFSVLVNNKHTKTCRCNQKGSSNHTNDRLF
jgi:hypothetical protein